MGRRLIALVLFCFSIAMIVVLQRKGTLVARCMRWCREHMGEAAFEPGCQTYRERCASVDVTFEACEPERQRLRVA
jgi:hypothetical protein